MTTITPIAQCDHGIRLSADCAECDRLACKAKFDRWPSGIPACRHDNFDDYFRRCDDCGQVFPDSLLTCDENEPEDEQ